MAGLMRLIRKIREKMKYNRRGKSNHDITPNTMPKSQRLRGCVLNKVLTPIHDVMGRGPPGMVGYGQDQSVYPVGS